MPTINVDIHWLPPLLPIILYAEVHYRIWKFFSRYFQHQPEILADAPCRIGPGRKLPIFLCIKHANHYPVVLKKVKIEVIEKSVRRVVLEKDYGSLSVCEALWYEIINCDLGALQNLVKIDVTISYSCRGKERVCVNDNYKLTSHAPLAVYCDAHPRPAMPGWVFGDMHTHSYLTDDQVEFGAPFDVSATMCRALELDFFASADHSYDLDDRLDNYLVNDAALPKWKFMWEQIDKLNKENKDMVIIPGEELSAGNRKKQNVHYLIFNNRTFFPGWGDGAEQWFRTKPQFRIADVLPQLEKDALSFAAHPVVNPPLLQKLLIRRGIWTNADLKLEGLSGAQFWNGDKKHFLQKGLSAWRGLLLDGCRTTLIAGTDAHGNFNRFRQIGTPHLSMREGTREIFGTAVTGVCLDGDLSLDSLLVGLRKGRVIVTDGPVVVFSFQPFAVRPEHLTTAGNFSTNVFIGESTKTSSGRITIDARSSTSFGEIKNLVLIIGDISRKKETRRRITMPSGLFTFSKNLVLEDCPKPGYLRLEMETSSQDRFFHCFTNPIFLD